MNRLWPLRGKPRRRALAATFFLASLAALACDGNSGPVDDTFILEGELVYQGSSSHDLTSVDEGIVRVEVLGLRPKLIQAPAGSTITVGLGLGRPGDNGCQASFRANARVGSVFSIGLEEKTLYCVLIFDSGSLPEDATIDYTVAVSPG